MMDVNNISTIALMLSVEDSARALSISPWSLRSHIQRGNVSPTRIGRRVLIARAELERIVREGLPSLAVAH